MRPMRIRWLGAARRRELLDALQAQVRLWSEEWSVAPDAFKIEPADDDSLSGAAGWHWKMAACAAGTLHLGVRLRMLNALGGLLANASVEDRLGLGRRVGERALQSLAARLTGEGSIGLSVGEMPSVKMREAKFGGLYVNLVGRGFDALLWLDSGLCDVLCPPPSRTAAPLDRKEAALGQETMILDLVVDLGSATVNDTSGLRVGEVLVSRTPLKNLFHLVTPDGKRIARGSPCRNGTSLAVQIESA